MQIEHLYAVMLIPNPVHTNTFTVFVQTASPPLFPALGDSIRVILDDVEC